MTICSVLQPPASWSVRWIYEHGAFTVYCITLAQTPTRKSISLALWALMFPRKALARQSVFSYNSVVVKRTEYIVEAVLIVNKDDFMSCKMLVVEINLVWKVLTLHSLLHTRHLSVTPGGGFLSTPNDCQMFHIINRPWFWKQSKLFVAFLRVSGWISVHTFKLIPEQQALTLSCALRCIRCALLPCLCVLFPSYSLSPLRSSGII